MTQDEFNQKNKKGEVELIKEPTLPPEIVALLQQKPKEDTQGNVADYASMLETLRHIKRFITTAPTNTPKSYLDAIEFYNNGATYRVYFYINKSWRYVTLT